MKEEETKHGGALDLLDLGKIVAEGTPNQLITENVADSVITLRLNPPLDVEEVQAVKGVIRASRSEGQYELITGMPQETLIEIMAWGRESGLEVTDINMKRATLEDVFLKLTGRKIRS